MDFVALAQRLGLRPHSVGKAKAPLDVSSLTLDSRRVQDEMIFFAAPGATAQSRDGHEFISRALDAGAVGLVVSDPARLPENVSVPVWVADDTRKCAAQAAEILFGEPTRAIKLCGVTGTNGKTTVTHLLAHLLQSAGHPTGMVGTLGQGRPGHLEHTGLTTPEAEDLSHAFAQWRDAEVTHATMEVSSHAVATQRVAGLHFEAAAFTNFSQDHLDFHGTLDAYFQAKADFFAEVVPADARAILPRGSGVHPRLNAFSPRQKEVFTWSREGAATVTAHEASLSIQGTRFVLQSGATRVPVNSPLVGDYNLDNLLCASTCALALGLDLHAVGMALHQTPPVPGRMEVVHAQGAHPDAPTIIVDYAHTPDALERALATVADLCEGRIIVVFGCGGDRDAGKREKMGAAAARGADQVVITDDNPRSEDPAAIRKSIESGARQAGAVEANLTNIGDREGAIAAALGMANGADCVLIAGKGHERTQTVGAQSRAFSDVDVARRLLQEAS
jgi:UDP-N-acetylmuramoyl-L-alanyl-D-glutamate--2,6-diaminopimelate ligase